MNGVLFEKSEACQTVVRPTSLGFTLRDYQAEDADTICEHWESGGSPVVCVHATGMGKSVMVAELIKRKPDGSRAMVVVDSTDLAFDLHRTIKQHTGRKPGLITGDFKENLDNDTLVATKQCLCAGDRFRELDPLSIDRLIVDECEAALANEYVLMLSHFIGGNQNLKLCGLTATPLPAGNRSIADLFPHAASGPGPLYRDLQWSYLNGWLVKPMQGVLRCSLDFSSLKIHERENGEQDYSDKDIAKLMLQQDERQWLELAGGIYKITKGHTAIVVCPNTTAIADRLAGYIEGHAREDGQRGVAYSIHRSLGRRRSWDLMRRFKAGEFPVAVSVKMFEKGFDYDRVNMVVMVRRTKSLRLYTQIAGRGTRPLTEIRQQLSNEPDPKQRMQLIANSSKPSCVIVDCVGINDDAKNMLGVIDILGRGVRDDVKERVRRMMLDKVRAMMAEEEAADDAVDEEPEPPGADVGDQARAAVKEMQEDYERQKRSRVSADVDVTYEVGKVSKAKPVKNDAIDRGDSSDKQVARCIALGVAPETALGYGRKQAAAVIGSYQKRGIEPDWSRVQAWRRRKSAPSALSQVGDGFWATYEQLRGVS